MSWDIGAAQKDGIDIGAIQEEEAVDGQLITHPGMDGLGNYQFGGNEMNGGFNA